MGRDALLDREQKEFIFDLKKGASRRGIKLTASNVIDKTREYLVTKMLEKERKLKHSQATEEEIRDKVNEEYLAESAIIDYNGEVNKILKNNENETTWSLASDVNIPSDMAPLLIEFLKNLRDMERNGGDLSGRRTIRHVTWMVRLFPYFVIVWERNYSLLPLTQKAGYLSRLADIYERYEDLHSLTGGIKSKQPLNTQELDMLFFVNGDLSFNAFAKSFEKMDGVK
jgi:hypothetical protein